MSQPPTHIKFCGLCDAQALALAVDLEVTWVGFVAVEQSPRGLELDAIAELVKLTPRTVKSVVLFLDPQRSTVERVIEQCRPDMLQFHGCESPDFCDSFDLPYFKAVHMGDHPNNNYNLLAQYQNVEAFLWDSSGPDTQGGSGHTFVWEQIPSEFRAQAVLAGGLHADNVGTAIAQIQPWGVDVSSGIEASKGVKSPDLMRAFVAAVRTADGIARVA